MNEKILNRRFVGEETCHVCGKKEEGLHRCLVCGNPCCYSDCTETNFDHYKASQFEFVQGEICKRCHPNMLRKFPPSSWVRKVIELYTCRYEHGRYDGQTEGYWRGWNLATVPGYEDGLLEEGFEPPFEFCDDEGERFRAVALPLEYR
jgi:hypothetical protein